SGADSVLVGTDEVIVDIEDRVGDSKKELGYIVVTEITPFIKYTFAAYRDTDWTDWVTYDDVGVDAAAYLVTNYAPTGEGADLQRDKQVPYMTVYMKKTETGFIVVEDDYEP
ncbi:hypothetical protein M3M33_13450, partial [Loigolactobacillus coryniformis]|uniref:hypothetical protein n=1 Tax=Loigolactobacillus coryniformis TaxID=1610 RepID=UPI00201AEB76